MSDQYVSIAGFVQFDPQVKDVNGQQILSFPIQAIGFQGQPLVQVTLWSEFAHVFGDVKLGTFVAVNGKYKQNNKDGKTYHNVSATRFAVNGVTVEKVERSDSPSAPAADATSAAAPF